ncbi:MAG: acyl-CoA dehydrogenase [Flavobacteriales bacterium]|nr:acyl-CoA dehydrogenase [Flavobacteriales bacterium]|tara:strand:+ start:4847 stop:6622 length:1776 start_codon:yes stop_codon:yes gene_type:complete
MKNKIIKGGEFLIKETDASDIFIPEEFDEEQNMIAQSSQDFLDQEVYPKLDEIDALKEGLMPELLTKAGELGLCGISVPEEYGGFGKNFVTSMLTAEVTGAGYSFAVALSAHTGIGTLPILYYGTEEQKQKYVPKLASGEWKGAYCLTEPGSGSDANSGKSKAILSEDGNHYVLNGQKMWITNGGFADIFTVFAKIEDDENLSAFIIEKGYEGITMNPEEKKMGIKGSSTRQIFFNDVKVPKENLLGERGEGFKIALNILNIGRAKLAAAALGAAKAAISRSVNYANEREQFGRQISKYGAIRHKLAEQAIKSFATESALYRLSQNIEDTIQAHIEGGMDKQKATMAGLREYAAECAILKVHGSETLDYVVDEGVQIYGGMGYSAEADMERAYRDARINRIFEGTNEINRMLTVDIILKRAMQGELNLLEPAQKVAEELMEIPDFDFDDSGEYAAEKRYIQNFKKAVLLTAGAAAKALTTSLAKEQEILMNIADIAMETYISESMLLRVQKMKSLGKDADLQEKMMQVYIYDAADRIHKWGKDAINAFAEGDEQRAMLMGIKRFSTHDPINAKEARQAIAQKMISENKYCY